MTLKTDFKDDILDLTVNDKRRYMLNENGDGSVSLSDVTAYKQIGSSYGALEINELNTAVNKLSGQAVIKLEASGWSAGAPYTQTAALEQARETDTPVVGFYVPEDATAAQVKQYAVNYGFLDRAQTLNGGVRFSCYNRKPAGDFYVLVKGV